jgi:hypothetical protein
MVNCRAMAWKNPLKHFKYELHHTAEWKAIYFLSKASQIPCNKSGNQIARKGPGLTSLAVGLVSKAAGWPPQAPFTSKKLPHFSDNCDLCPVLGSPIQGHLQNTISRPLGKLPSLALSWNNGQRCRGKGTNEPRGNSSLNPCSNWHE